MADKNTTRLFLFAASFYFASVGLQGVIFSSLVVFTLKADPLWIGTAQSALMIPSVFFVLVGGHVADQAERRRLLIGLCVAAGVLSLALFTVVATDTLSLPVLIVYALCAGTIQAFVMPARDAMLSDVIAGDMSRAVAGLLMAQWGSQAIGALIGASARFVGVEVAILGHAALVLGGIPLLARLPRSQGQAHANEESALSGILAGLREVWTTPALRIPFLLAATVGVFGIGPYIVVVPVLVRNVYLGGIGELGIISAAFPIGTIMGSMLVLRTGIRRKGLAQGLALACGSLCILTIGLGIPFVAAVAAVFGWGTAASVFMNAGRSLFQERASPSHRGRVLSVYTLGFMGTSGLIGAPLFGALLDVLGSYGSLILASFCSLSVIGLIGLRGGYRKVDGLQA